MTIIKAEAGIEPRKALDSSSIKYPWKTMEVGESFLVAATSKNAQ